MKQIAFALAVILLAMSLAACDGITININLNGTEATAPEETTAPDLQEETTPSAGQDATEPEETDSATSTATEPPETALTPEEALWAQLAGCWVGGDDRFAYFTYVNGAPGFLGGFWGNPQPYGRDPATVSGLYQHSSGMYTMNLTYPPVSGDAADSQDLRELSYTLMVDISTLDQGTITVEAPDDTLRTYTYGGDSYEEAYAAVYGGEATFDGLYDVWHRLVGYWITNSEVYAVLDMADSHTAVFHYGWWETEFDSGEQIVRELTASGEEEMTATLADGGIVVIDYSGLERDGKIRIKIGDQEWMQCANGGGSAQEAYQTYCSNREGA